MNEADTCRIHITPKLQAAGWEDSPHTIREQKTFTDGRIIVTGSKVRRGQQKRADYLLYFLRDFLIALVEAKGEDELATDGVQQAREYTQSFWV